MKGFFKEDTEQWKRARLSAWAAVAPHVKRMPTPERWLPLPGETQFSKTTKQELMEFSKMLYEKGILRDN